MHGRGRTPNARHHLLHFILVEALLCRVSRSSSLGCVKVVPGKVIKGIEEDAIGVIDPIGHDDPAIASDESCSRSTRPPN